jgi:hypothetical protein
MAEMGCPYGPSSHPNIRKTNRHLGQSVNSTSRSRSKKNWVVGNWETSMCLLSGKLRRINSVVAQALKVFITVSRKILLTSCHNLVFFLGSWRRTT